MPSVAVGQAVEASIAQQIGILKRTPDSSADYGVFGNIIAGTEVEAALISTLDSWLPTYIREVERQHGREQGRIPSPRLYDTVTEFDTFDEGQLPLCLVVSPGLADRPYKDGEGIYIAPFLVGVAVICSASTERATQVLAKIYGAAVRACVLQKRLPDLGGQVAWVDESYDDIPEIEQRTLAAAQLIFTVEVDDVVSSIGGPLAPADPETQPGQMWSTVETVEIDVERKEE